MVTKLPIMYVDTDRTRSRTGARGYCRHCCAARGILQLYETVAWTTDGFDTGQCSGANGYDAVVLMIE